MMKNVIFIAPPSAGKGTVSGYLVKNYHYKHLSTGDLLREEIASGSRFGKELDEIISKGNLVSDEVMIELVQSKLKSFNSHEPFILDGFPRTLIQAKKLDEMLDSLGITNTIAVYLELDYEIALQRVLGRVSCPKCKKSYNIYFDEAKPKNGNVCDDCHIELVKRTDDNEETFSTRFHSYLDNASSILDYYRNHNMLTVVDASKNIDSVVNDVVDMIKEAKE